MIEFDQKWFIFFKIVSPAAVHTLLPSVLQRLNSCGIEALILILEKSSTACRYDIIIGPIMLPSQVLFRVGGTENSQIVPNQDNMEGDQPVQSHSHEQQLLQPQACVQAHCPGETEDSLRLFSRPFWNVSRYYFSKSWGNNAVCIRKGWIKKKCMPSLIAVAQLFLSQPMNFQPTLVHTI